MTRPVRFTFCRTPFGSHREVASQPLSLPNQLHVSCPRPVLSVPAAFFTHWVLSCRAGPRSGHDREEQQLGRYLCPVPPLARGPRLCHAPVPAVRTSVGHIASPPTTPPRTCGPLLLFLERVSGLVWPQTGEVREEGQFTNKGHCRPWQIFQRNSSCPRQRF